MSILSQKIVAKLSNECTTKQLWNKLVVTYSQILESRILFLKHEFQNISKRYVSILEYLGCINKVAHQLAENVVSNKENV